MSDSLVITFNAGSSSLRCGVYCAHEGAPEAMFSISIRGLPRRMILEVSDHGKGTTDESELEAPGDAPHEDAFSTVMQALRDRVEMAQVTAVSHRVVHGGLEYMSPVRVTDEVITQLDALSPLAPSHQPHNLRPIRVLSQQYPAIPQIACFDTAFHRHQPRLAQLYALPRSLSKDGILRFGFHGLSYEHIGNTLRRDHPHLHAGRTIVAHLGHGVSLCALEKGRSVATTMGLTALDGMPMGQRCGRFDPGAVLHLILDRGYTPEEVRNLLYEQSGLLGVSGISGEMADLLTSDSSEAAEAVSLFVYRFRREVGSLTAALGGIDGLVLTGGMAEHLPELRQRLCEAVEWYGGIFDKDANENGASVLSSADSRFEILMLPTDEESVLARAAVDPRS